MRWRTYAVIWGGAIAIGLVIGVAPDFWPRTDADEVQALAAAGAWPARATAVDTATLPLGAPAEPAETETPKLPGVRANFGFCHKGGGYNCVVDGDTIWLEGQKVRLADIDAPETHDYDCASEKQLGDRATQRLQELLGSGAVTLQSIDRDEDVYGRKLRRVFVDGESVGDTLVSEGLVRPYGNGRRPWC